MRTQTLAKQGKILALKVVLLQIIVVLVATVLAFYWKEVASFSIWVGGVICILPNSYFAFKAFKYAGARQAHQIVVNIYAGEAVKILLTVVLFVVAFKILSVLPGPLFLGYALALVFNWLALFIFRKSHQ